MLLRLLKAALSPRFDQEIEDPIGHVIARTQPRILITFGIERRNDLPSDCHLYAIDVPGEVQASSGLDSVDEFFARASRSNAYATPKKRPARFDLAIVGPDYRLNARRRIMAGLHGLAHSRSVVMFVRRPSDSAWNRRRSVMQGFAGLASLFERIEGAAIESETPALLIGDLDVATQRRKAPRRPRHFRLHLGNQQLDRFLGAHQIDRPPPSIAAHPVQDAPCVKGEVVTPRYNRISAHGPRLKSRASDGGRSSGRWWNKPLRTMDAAVTVAENVGFVTADGHNKAVLTDEQGLLLPATHRWQLGYGETLDDIELQVPTFVVHDRNGRRRPLQEAKDLLTNRREAGDFLALGFLDDRFGHFLVESLASGWALDWALARGMRILIWGPSRSFHASALALLGIPEDRIVVATPGTTYARVFMPDPAFRLMGSISPLAGGIWDRMADRAMEGTHPGPAAEPFLFLSRAGVRTRRLTNARKLDAAMAERGGLVVRPERMSFEEQVRTVRRARAVVGCFGSQLHLSIFQARGTRKLVIGIEDFTGPEETLISLVNGTEVDYYFEPTPPGVRGRARRAPWTLDLERFLPAFDRWLEQQVPAAKTCLSNASAGE